MAPQGQTPVNNGTGTHFKANRIVVISSKGALRFSTFEQKFTGRVFLDYLKCLVKDSRGRMVVLILDGYSAHRARIVKDWVAERPELHFLPGSSPELNPAERLNQDVKSNAQGTRRPRNVTEFKDGVRSFLISRQRRPATVAAYFQERHVRYAAEATT